MTLKQIEAFYWAAALGNFAMAAARLHITQSSLSKRIAELESELDQTLFDRSHKHSALTLAGERLLPRCRTML
ncbi:MAG: LysR family transcriptional regulator, partial [Alcaligenaceae bacterium]